MSYTNDLIKRLKICPPGKPGWSDFESICIEILNFLFVPPLAEPKIQPRTYSGIDRRDAVYPNRNFDSSTTWGKIFNELDARMILFEFKNYDKSDVGKEEVDQTRNYLRKPMGKLAIMICSKNPDNSAHIRRNTVYSDEGKVILFMGKDELVEMLDIKERGGDPTDLIVDIIEWFYLQHE